MKGGVQIVQYSDVIARLTEFETWLTARGLRRGPNRLRHIIQRLQQVEQSRQEGTLAELSASPDIEETVWSVVEAFEFDEIFSGLRAYDPSVLTRLVRRALQGPFRPLSEAPHGSNLGRNTTFELRLGSGLLQAGADVTLGDQADIVFNLAGARIYIECKRPFFPHTLRSSIERARWQLRKRLDADSASAKAGIVAISVSRVVNAGGELFLAATPNDLRGLEKEVLDLHVQYSSDFDRLVDLRLLGIIYHLYTPAFIRSLALLGAATQSLVALSGPAVQTLFPISRSTALGPLLQRALGESRFLSNTRS